MKILYLYDGAGNMTQCFRFSGAEDIETVLAGVVKPAKMVYYDTDVPGSLEYDFTKPPAPKIEPKRTKTRRKRKT